MKQFILLLAFVFTQSSYGQMSSASIFSEMKSINPAVIGQRVGGHMTVIGDYSKIEKTQTGVLGTADADIATEVQGVNIFRGGNGNGGKDLITSEITYVYSTGTRVTTVTSPIDTMESDTAVDFSITSVAFGIWDYLGVGYSRSTYSAEDSFNNEFAGTSYSENFKNESTVTGIIIGAAPSFGNFDFGCYYQRDSMNMVSSGTVDVIGGGKNTYSLAGMALGLSGKNAHFEIAYERSLDSYTNPETNKSYIASRASVTIEAEIAKILLGYTGRLYMAGFENREKTVINQLGFPFNPDKDRLEHIVNFSLGIKKGFAFGGSASYSKTEAEEANPLAGSTMKYPTITKFLGVMINLGYVW